MTDPYQAPPTRQYGPSPYGTAQPPNTAQPYGTPPPYGGNPGGYPGQQPGYEPAGYPAPRPPQPPRGGNTALWVVLGGLIGVALLVGVVVAIVASANRSHTDSALRTSVSGSSTTSDIATTDPAVPVVTTESGGTTGSSGPRTSSDTAFVNALANNNVPYSSEDAAITLAHAVCDARASGNTETSIGLTIADKGYSYHDAGFIVGAAEAAYCPQYH